MGKFRSGLDTLHLRELLQRAKYLLAILMPLLKWLCKRVNGSRNSASAASSQETERVKPKQEEIDGIG